MYFPSYKESIATNISEEGIIAQIKRVRVSFAGTSYTVQHGPDDHSFRFTPASDFALFHNSFAPVVHLIVNQTSDSSTSIEIVSCLSKSVRFLIMIMCALPLISLLCALLFPQARSDFLLFSLCSLIVIPVNYVVPHIGFYFMNRSFVTQFKSLLQES